ncbi:Pyridoxal phosphate-dependent transferase, major domain protein [Niveomyces insectorum RCEF 264]|uniref:Pyridoxal phosphate-dependent transferase, major domain protein n=1 Tax=Niveomyces insectorum RCEF 264 TaxID=1081102 RepID=A0A167TSX0_9HYPO|nr:Pyridoxal phosphate-dependent transferase, major domain protein [Niveomyces insectorum RCEF 264]
MAGYFSNRKFSINRNTGAPKPPRRFSVGEPGVNEASSRIHRQFRAAHEGHLPHAGLDATRSSTGVVWCTERAAEFGFLDEPETWANLGQGAPEVEDDIAGSFQRPQTLDIAVASREYGPTAGIRPLREAVAKLYNAHHRQGKASQYTWENVAIVPGGRAGLIRIAAVLNNAYVAFFIPDYTAYNEMLSLFKNFAAIPVPLSEEDGYHIHPNKVAEEIARGTGVILTSNPRNPTGRVVANPELAEIQDLCRARATLISDEFYSGYNYTSNCDGTTISAAANVVDVDSDDVLILDGLTKRFRLPGWRVAWILGPKEFIQAIGSCGSYLDGGANVPFQEAAVPMLEPQLVHQEMAALQRHFCAKRDYVIGRLRAMGFSIRNVPDSTFYLWLDLEGLPKAIADGLNFFQACLEEKVIVVPGIFFDLNPSRRRDLFDSPCHHFVRFSYGPKMETLKRGCDGIERVLNKYKKESEAVIEDDE